MGRPVRVIKAEAYREVAGWLDEMAVRMQRESEESVFSPRPAVAKLDAKGVRGLARDLRKRADTTEKG
jgi:hypothetical protein